MKVLMVPTLAQFEGEESGIKRVVEAYHRYAPKYDIEFVNCPVEEESAYDLFAVHAGTSQRYPKRKPVVAMCHGLYWTADYNSNSWEWKTNTNVIESLRLATVITVPSPWVGETIARDLRRAARFVPHGVEADQWAHNLIHKGYVLWNKNRASDVCSPDPMIALAKMTPEMEFITTFAPQVFPDNVHPQGIIKHDQMKTLVQEAAVYLSTTKETFGIGVLEALASGTPVLGFDYGGNSLLVKHGVTGYLAKPGNYHDLKNGLEFCMMHRDALSKNARIAAREWTWNKSMRIVRSVFDEAIEIGKADSIVLNRPEKEYRNGAE